MEIIIRHRKSFQYRRSRSLSSSEWQSDNQRRHCGEYGGAQGAEASIVFKVNGGSSVDNLTGLTDQVISDLTMPKPKTGSSAQSKRVTQNAAKAGEPLEFAAWAGVMLTALVCGLAAANCKKNAKHK